ncbi:hypothetical protein DASC09_063550 [Saccharomycopsis crataegensis]|uniref:Uncharacterized protein n=1 Tax=Saccharomycopsis crataegensis TaxID=43959 RepID=A0AAV5QX02_9ASCO|nr:hypothetical protein DASC09_063550 [Saccharomycopsis crataegensis]
MYRGSGDSLEDIFGTPKKFTTFESNYSDDEDLDHHQEDAHTIAKIKRLSAINCQLSQKEISSPSPSSSPNNTIIPPPTQNVSANIIREDSVVASPFTTTNDLFDDKNSMAEEMNSSINDKNDNIHQKNYTDEVKPIEELNHTDNKMRVSTDTDTLNYNNNNNTPNGYKKPKHKSSLYRSLKKSASYLSDIKFVQKNIISNKIDITEGYIPSTTANTANSQDVGSEDTNSSHSYTLSPPLKDNNQPQSSSRIFRALSTILDTSIDPAKLPPSPQPSQKTSVNSADSGSTKNHKPIAMSEPLRQMSSVSPDAKRVKKTKSLFSFENEGQVSK